MGRPLRFCMITTFYPPYSFGGDAAFVRLLSNELARRGHHVEVIHCADSHRLLAKKQTKTSNNEQQEHSNLLVHRLESPFGFLSPLATQQTGFPFFKSTRIRQILDKGFDVIHYHNISLVGGPKILEYGRAIKLYSIHEYWLICPTHVLFKFNRAPCTSRSCFTCSLIHLRPPQWWRYTGLLKTMVKHVDRFIGASNFVKDIHHQMGLDIPIVRLPYFLPPAETVSLSAESPIDREADVPYFLFVGRLEKLKGLQTLIPVFRDNPKARLLIAGSGNFESHLKQLAAGSENIRFLGHQSAGQLQALYRKALAVIVPSLCFDVSPMVILEAFREGTPAIVNNLGGMPEMIEKSGGGFVYTTQAELLAAINQLSAERSCRERLGAAAFQAYQQNWTPEIHVETYLSLIREIAATRNEPPD